MRPTRIQVRLAAGLLAGALPCAAQGLATLQERAVLIVEARIQRESEQVRAEVRRVWKGPQGLSRLDLFLPDRISAHARPRTGAWHILHLVPLASPGRLWAPLQMPLAVISFEGPEGPALAGLVGRLAAHRHDPARLAADLTEALGSRWPLLVDAAAQDLLARPDLLRLAPPEAAARVVERLEEQPMHPAACLSLLHLIGALAPAGWEDYLAELTTRPEFEALAPVAGAVLAAHLGQESVALLVRRAGSEPTPCGVLLALGATRRPEALDLLGRELARTGREATACAALSLHRSRQACEIVALSLAACPEGEMDRARFLAETLARMPLTHGRRLLTEVARGHRAPAHAEVARQALAR